MGTRRRRAARWIVAAVAAAALAAPAAPVAAAAPVWNDPVTVIRGGCGYGGNLDAAMGADGVVRGFVSDTDGCNGGRIRYFQGSGRDWTVQDTPWLGQVQAAATWGGNAVLLYSSGDRLRIAGRTGGRYTAGRQIGPRSASGADVVVNASGWWAVWSEDLPGTARTQLYQARTMGAGRNREAITTAVAINHRDTSPSLALRPGGGVTLVWSRVSSQTGNQLRIAASTGGRWSSRLLSKTTEKADTDLAVSGSRTFVAYEHGYRVFEADDLGGGPVRQRYRFNTNGFRPKVAASGGNSFVSLWGGRDGVFVATRQGRGRWTGQNAGDGQPLRILAARGKATVLYGNDTGLFARTQR
jgi:hypothetical protein